MSDTLKKRNVIPGFSLSLGYTLFYLCLIILIPMAALFFKTASLSWQDFWNIVTHPRVVASYKLTFGASFLGGLINTVFGFLAAWVLVRYSFPGKKIVDMLIDLPFALPTAVAGITLTAIYSENGLIGNFFKDYGIKIAFTPIGVVLALTFIGLPFVVRTVQPVLQDLDSEMEEAAACLGASRFQTFTKIILPALLPALLTGFTLAFARALGEFGSVVFIAANIPFKTEITSFLIITKLEQYDFTGATALATVMLTISFVLLFLINLLQGWISRTQKA